AWWWMTRFTRIENLEAVFGAAEARAVKAATLPLPAVEAAVGAALETLDAVEQAAEKVVEPALEAVVETEVGITAGTLDEVLAEAPPAPILDAIETAQVEAEAPVGGESAPISPVVAAMTPQADTPAEVAADAEAGKPKRKPASPKAE